MVRKPFVAGNWKMNTTRDEGTALVEALAAGLGPAAAIDVAVCPPSVYLDAVAAATKATAIAVGAQNMYFEPKGAFTGEVSAAMLKDVGCSFAILGHSERRHVLGETDELINAKVLAALAAGLKVILCVGEKSEQREANKTHNINAGQVCLGLAGVTRQQMDAVTIAYEPVWAIGTGKTATPADAQEAHAAIRKTLAALYDDEVAAATRIQYGGSVKPSNAGELMAQPDVDGALVGGASLKADDFLGIIQATCKAKGVR